MCIFIGLHRGQAMKNKWIIPVVLFIILICAYAVRGMFQARIELEVLQKGRIEESQTTKAVLIKNEIVKSLELSGSAEVYADDNERVARNEILAILHASSEDEALIKEFSQINKKIAAIRASDADSSIYISDTMQMESEISSYVDDLIQSCSDNDFSKMSEYKYKISMITAQKAIVRGEAVTTPAEEVLALQARKNQIEAQLGNSANIVTADVAGIFIEGKDGFEETVKADSINTLTPGVIKDVITNSKNGNLINEGNIYTYKIVDNFKYSIAVNVEKSLTEGIKVGDSVNIRFLDFSNSDVPAVVTYISEPDEDGTRTVVAESDKYVKNLMSQRVVNVDFVKKSVSGYKVNIEYIHTVDNTIGLFIKRGAVMRFLPINIEYSNEEEAIVTSANPSMPIRSYDEIVKSAPEFSDGKVIVSQ